MVTEAWARQAVGEVLAQLAAPADLDDEITVWKVEEHAQAWILHLATRRYVHTQDVRDLPIGASPFVVDKSTGQLHQYGSSSSEYDKFVAWLDTR